MINIYFRDGKRVFKDDEKLKFKSQVNNLFSSFPSDSVGCCCVVKRSKGVSLHMNVRAKLGVFEGNIKAKDLNQLAHSLRKHFRPQLSSWRASTRKGNFFNMCIPVTNPMKKEICTAELCPINQEKGIWPSQY